MPRFPSPEWLESYKEAINADERFKDEGGDWEGDVTYVIEAEPGSGLQDDAWGWFDLWHGRCRDAKVVSPEDGERARFVIRAPYSTWKEVIRGRVDPVKGMTQGKLKLSGDLPTIREHIGAVDALVSIAGDIESLFSDE